MRLAKTLPFGVIVILILAVTAFGQTLRPGNDPRNQAPTVGTGGTPGGPTGLFTIYDGDTLRKGEFTFSIAYSNYDRDPGNVDISEVPLSFNIGLNDYVELFFSTEAHRKVESHNPQNLSGFYLPNTGLAAGCVPFAIISTPTIVSGGITTLPATVGTNGVFRPNCNQPLVAFPFVNGTGPNFGLTGNIIAPAVTTRLGPVTGGGNGSRGAAALFAGIGAPGGSILPGVVLTTRTIPPSLTSNTITVPDTYTVLPSYLPDAPFLGVNGDSTSFGTITIGGKFRFTSPRNPLGAGLVAFYRFYMDKANDASGFDQLQRGSSPGGNAGDFGIVGFVSGRLSRSVQVSSNFGYIFNSNPRSSAFGGDFTLLDRPDEFIAGIGFDFPINKHVAPMFELKTIRYVGTDTPNSFPNDPVEFLAGIRVFANPNVGFSAAYRRHLNQQNQSAYNTAFPNGFIGSDDPNGFMFQFFAGRRNARAPEVLPNQPPTANLAASASTITLPCPPGPRSDTCPTSASSSVGLTTTASDPDGDTLLYSYTVTGGRVTGEGASVNWDLSGVGPGTYTASVEVDDGCGCITAATTTVTIAACSNCVAPPQPTPEATPMPTPEPTPIPPPKSRKFDEYGNIRFNDEKARLDNFAIQLQNEPTAQGYIIGYGSCDGEGQTRANRAKDYLVNTRGIDAGRLMVVDGGCMPELKVELWVVPSGATPPAADTTGSVSPCPSCKKKPARRRGRGRGEE